MKPGLCSNCRKPLVAHPFQDCRRGDTRIVLVCRGCDMLERWPRLRAAPAA